MSTVVRGTIRVAKYLPFKLNGKPITAQTLLAVSIRSTRFPTISVKINRDAYPATASSGPTSGQVFSGKTLPWASNPFQAIEADTGQLSAVTNGMQDGAPAKHFSAEQSEAPDPACSDDTSTDTTRASSADTICWLFKDQRP